MIIFLVELGQPSEAALQSFLQAWGVVPRELRIRVESPFQKAAPGVERPYDISRDGQHFLGLIDAAQTQSGAPAAEQIQVVLNWFEELKARVPSK